MSVMNSNQFKSAVEPVMVDVFNGLYKQRRNEWKQVFEQRTAIKRRYQESSVLAGLGVAPMKPEGAPVAYSVGGEAWRKQYIFRTFALAFAMTEEMIEDGDWMDLSSVYTKHLARSMAESSELYHADIFNFAFSGTPGHIGGDGQPLLSDAHPLFDGNFASNILDTAAQLSEGALEELLTQINLTPNERGFLGDVRARRLIVAPGAIFTAHRILESAGRVGTANNDANAIKDMGLFPDGVVQLSRLTNPNAFYIQTDAEDGLIHYQRAPLRTTMEGDFESSNMRVKARERYEAGWTDWRALFGSNAIA